MVERAFQWNAFDNAFQIVGGELMGTTTLSVLEQRLAESISDWLEVAVTTAIAANNSIVSTNLQSYDGGRDSFRVDGWVYITNQANAGVQRQISAYTSSTGTLTVRGAALLTDGANLATIRVHRYNRDKYVQAFNDTSRELYGLGYFWKELNFYELVTGNILPNAHFRNWDVSTAPDKYSMQDSNITATAQTTWTAGGYRGGAKSMKAATGASGAGKYVYISSDTYPRLLDLSGQTVNLYCWALPEVANDGSMEIYTKKADGTAQTLTTITANPAGEFTLLKLENKLLNKDLVEVQVRFKVATASKYVCFDNARVTGTYVQEYLLPTDFVGGVISTIEIQSKGSGYGGTATTAFACDDLLPRYWSPVHDYEIFSDGTDRWLRLGQQWESSRLIRLIGKAPLTTLSASTDTIEIGEVYPNPYIAYAEYKLAEAIESPVASQDIGRYETWAAKAYAKWMRINNIRMTSRPQKMRIDTF